MAEDDGGGDEVLWLVLLAALMAAVWLVTSDVIDAVQGTGRWR